MAPVGYQNKTNNVSDVMFFTEMCVKITHFQDKTTHIMVQRYQNYEECHLQHLSCVEWAVHPSKILAPTQNIAFITILSSAAVMTHPADSGPLFNKVSMLGEIRRYTLY